MPSTSLAKKSEGAAVSALVVASEDAVRPCRPACGQARTGRKTSACSDKCRAVKSRRNRTEGQAERDRRGRELLGAALRVLAWVEEPTA